MIIQKGKFTRRAALHLTAGIVGLPLSQNLLGCTVEGTRVKEPHYMRLITEIAERIIPETDTPGAITAGVPDYIKMLLDEWYPPEESLSFIQALEAFDAAALKAGHEDYMSADSDTKNNILVSMENSGSEIFQELKQLATFGYYTSEASSQELQYDPVPGEYRGCVPLQEVGTAWLTTGI